MSVRWSEACPWINSGDMYAAVPAVLPSLASGESPPLLISPKSIT